MSQIDLLYKLEAFDYTIQQKWVKVKSYPKFSILHNLQSGKSSVSYVLGLASNALVLHVQVQWDDPFGGHIKNGVSFGFWM